MRPVVPQDLAAAATRVALGLVAALVAIDPRERPLLGLVVVLAVGVVLVTEHVGKSREDVREWVDDMTDVPLVPAVVLPTSQAVRVGLALGGAGGLALVLLAWWGTTPPYDSAVPTFAVTGIVLARSSARLRSTRAARLWERDHDLVLCRRPAGRRVVLMHKTDVERMVAVPATGDVRAA